jgi:GWxTD domain-containing protein
VVGMLLFLVIVGCYTQVPSDGDAYKYDFSALYNPSQSSLHPECMVYHHKDEISLMFFNQNTSELYFAPNTKGEKKAQLIVKYLLRNQLTKELVDSLTSSFSFDINDNGKTISSYIEIKAQAGNTYDLIVLFADAAKKNYRRLLIEVDKTSLFSEQNFFVEKLGEANTPVFNRVVYSNNKYRVLSNRINAKSCLGEYYANVQTVAAPPNIIQMPNEVLRPDTSFTINYGDTIEFYKEGIYRFAPSEGFSGGLCLLNRSDYFPMIKSLESMISSLVYITTVKQIDKIKSADNQKLLLDEFWLNLTNDRNRAKELIRIYYNRVQLANMFFTTHIEGWRTDRGMLFIVFGPPNTIYKTPNSEEWIYSDNPSLSSLSFTFMQRENIFTANDYYLIRDTKYQTVWAQAIETWRRGRAFSMNSK